MPTMAVRMLVINGTGLVTEVFLECHDADEGERANLLTARE
ncbi:MAG TPA: hypothetical protein VFO16_02485 [Pseudonocardiaceae bacterium]|nr:hypothetical protein [Pseudonocardiaceae bacterium]